MRTMTCLPDVYPYVCFLERIGDPAVERPSLPAHAVQGPPALAADAEESEGASTSQESAPGEEDEEEDEEEPLSSGRRTRPKLDESFSKGSAARTTSLQSLVILSASK